MPYTSRRVSFSYSREDINQITPIEEAFWAAGLVTASDRKSVSVETFEEALERELEGAQCVIVFWSESAAQSRFAERGLRTAIRAWSSGRLLLVALDDTPLPVGLRDISPISVRSASGSGIKELIERAKAVVAASGRNESIRPLPKALPKGGDHFTTFGRVGIALAVLTLFPYLFRGLINRFLDANVNAYLGHKDAVPNEISPPPSDAPEMWLLFVFGALFVGVLIGLGAAWARGLRTRRTSKTLPIVTLAPAKTAEHDPHVFVSYSRQDADIVEGLVSEIEGMGYEVWIDRKASDARRYAAPIVGAIRSAKLIALMCSRNAFASDHVIREIYVAGDLKKPFIAFQLDVADFPDDVLYFLSGFPRIPIASVNPQHLRSELARFVKGQAGSKA
jgi:hypothetical protein